VYSKFHIAERGWQEPAPPEISLGMEAKVMVALAKLQEISESQAASEHCDKVRAHVKKIIRRLIASRGKDQVTNIDQRLLRKAAREG
jgi:hypothetical protein